MDHLPQNIIKLSLSTGTPFHLLTQLEPASWVGDQRSHAHSELAAHFRFFVLQSPSWNSSILPLLFCFISGIQGNNEASVRSLEPLLLQGPACSHLLISLGQASTCLVPNPCPATTAALHPGGSGIRDRENCCWAHTSCLWVMGWDPEGLWVSMLTPQVSWSQRERYDLK